MIVARQVSPSLWLSRSDMQSTIDTIYALSFLSAFRKNQENPHWSHLLELCEILVKDVLKDRESYIAYCLGMGLLLNEKIMKYDDVRNQLLEISRKLTFKKNNSDLLADVLYGLALFWLVLWGKTDGLSTIEDEVYHDAEILCKSFGSIKSTESKVKLLFTLSIFPKCSNLLSELHLHRRIDVENIRKSPISEKVKILLLKPFTDLEINCHKSLVTEALVPLRTEARSIIERGILQRISSLLVFGENASLGTRLETEDNISRLVVDLSEKELTTLQEPEVSVRYPSIVGLSLIATGYSDVYIVPEKESGDYTQYRMKVAEEHGNAIRTKKRGLRKLVDNYIRITHRFKLFKSILLMILWLIFAYLGGSALFSYFQGTLEVGPSITGIGSTILLLLLSTIEKVPVDFYNSIVKRKEHKTETTETVMGMLGIEEGVLSD